MNIITDLFSSKKFIMALSGIVVVVVVNFVPEIDEESLTQIVGLILMAIFGQAMADFGKEAKK